VLNGDICSTTVAHAGPAPSWTGPPRFAKAWLARLSLEMIQTAKIAADTLVWSEKTELYFILPIIYRLWKRLDIPPRSRGLAVRKVSVR